MDIAELHKLFVKHQTITTDTRDCPENSIFLALKGETFCQIHSCRRLPEDSSATCSLSS